uniref:NADH dehydrogenase subunit 2 n=1 Tax=Rhabditophanes sp. KR3021 TaxID=114890 RepID=A0AC35UIK5_9BILA
IIIFLRFIVILLFILNFNLSFSRLINYFIIQETAGILFLLLNFTILQFLVILLKIDSRFYNWETVLVFINLPLRITFFIKIFSLISVFQYNSFIVLLILFLIFLSILRFGF